MGFTCKCGGHILNNGRCAKCGIQNISGSGQGWAIIIDGKELDLSNLSTSGDNNMNIGTNNINA